jgi:carboxyl-terminal processing protease
MKFNQENKRYLLPILFASTLVLGLIIGSRLSGSRGGSSALDNKQIQKISDVVQLLDARYVDNIDKDKIFEETISEMLHKLDPHSNYISAKEMLAVSESIEGKFGGIGIRFQIIRDTVCITNVIEGSPSQSVGIRSGDKIIKINKKLFTGKKITNELVFSNLKGAVGTTVQLTVVRNKKEIPFTITRGEIPLKTVVGIYMIDKETGYIGIEQFSIPTADEFHQAAVKLKGLGMKKLILDLRNNGGGVLQASTMIADEFLSKGLVILKTKGRKEKEKTYYATSGGVLENISAVVLVNAYSASASEILAGALQDNDRAYIVGRRTFGKGLVQEDIPLRDGSNVRITVARYYTPSGRCIQKPYSGNYEEYLKDESRVEKGEWYHLDSSLYVDSLKFKTRGGRTVYGGGGITPDVFVPYDTTESSFYLTELIMSGAFQSFAFDFVSNKRNSWSGAKDFCERFVVNDKILQRFVAYAKNSHNVKENIIDLKRSKSYIINNIKSEIARQLWPDEGYYRVVNTKDIELKRAMEQLRKMK